MSDLSALDAVSAGFGRLISELKPGELSLPSPCDGWTIENVISHVCGGNLRFRAVFAGDARPEFPMTLDGEPLEVFDDSFAAFRAAALVPGALDGEYEFRGRLLKGSTLVKMRANEFLVHAWDIARALGCDPGFDDDEVEGGIAVAHEILAGRPREVGGSWGPEKDVSPGASPLDRLAAYCGRTV